MGGMTWWRKEQEKTLNEKVAEEIVKIYDLPGRFRAVEILPDDVLRHVSKMCLEELEKR